MSAICTPMPADLIVRGGPNSGDRCDHGPIELRIGSSLEVADIFRAYGDAYRATYRLSGQQLRVMQAIETCRTAAFGGHRSRCNHCGAEVARYPTPAAIATVPAASSNPFYGKYSTLGVRQARVFVLSTSHRILFIMSCTT
jgi:Transposase zinc-binding domain